MKAIADISIIPLGVGLSLSSYVAACEKVFNEHGLEPRLHANGTNVEGELGVPRIATNLRLGTRIDREPSMDAKMRSVQEKIER
jgi:uncharacterized protein YqgV (UPF0045/DUF77 family)